MLNVYLVGGNATLLVNARYVDLLIFRNRLSSHHQRYYRGCRCDYTYRETYAPFDPPRVSALSPYIRGLMQ